MRPFTVDDMAGLIGENTDGLILEIGANDGEDTHAFLRKLRRARFACFECDPRAIEKWRRRIKDPRAVLTEAALADQDGTMPFHPSGGTPPGDQWAKYGDWDKSGSLLPFDRHTDYATWMQPKTPITVKTLRLDTWRWVTGHVGRIEFAWIDVQGAEAMVLRGAEETIRQVKYVYAECDSRPLYQGMATLDDLHALLPSFRYVREYSDFNHLWENTAI
jgi:2-O-methyltransferase